MRMRVAVMAGLLVLGLAVAPSFSAPPATTRADPGTGSISAIGPRGGVRRAPDLGPVVSALSASECTNLGGKVYDDIYGVCASKKVCSTTDNKGANHAVCLSATAGNVW
ncbi:MAG: hypothetical protein ACTHOI_12475 [Sphingomicrobium sp.]